MSERTLLPCPFCGARPKLWGSDAVTCETPNCPIRRIPIHASVWSDDNPWRRPAPAAETARQPIDASPSALYREVEAGNRAAETARPTLAHSWRTQECGPAICVHCGLDYTQKERPCKPVPTEPAPGGEWTPTQRRAAQQVRYQVETDYELDGICAEIAKHAALFLPSPVSPPAPIGDEALAKDLAMTLRRAGGDNMHGWWLAVARRARQLLSAPPAPFDVEACAKEIVDYLHLTCDRIVFEWDVAEKIRKHLRAPPAQVVRVPDAEMEDLRERAARVALENGHAVTAFEIETLPLRSPERGDEGREIT